MKKKNRVGEKYGMLEVIEQADTIKHPNGNTSICWKCRCDCGNEITVIGSNLQSRHTTSCGCLKRLFPNATRHGESGTRLYHIWVNMRQRCNNPKNNNYKNYGGRGIEVCGEWEADFAIFGKWAIQNGYADNLTLDRIDNDGNYEPNNCRWTTRLIQRHNQRRLCDWQNLHRLDKPL